MKARNERDRRVLQLGAETMKAAEESVRAMHEADDQLRKIRRLASQANPPAGVEEYQWVNFLKKAGLWLDPKKVRP